jgi:1-acyl-sn-glycerol-3-phosphate acyltransferase
MKVSPIQLVFPFLLVSTSAFTVPSTPTITQQSSSLFPKPRCHSCNRSSPHLSASSTTTLSSSESNGDDTRFGRFTFKCKYGYLNPFAIYYGITSILLGIPWFVALNICQLFYKITGNRYDKLRKLPIFCSQTWGYLLLRMTRSYPNVEGGEILDKFFKENRAAMFVANHNSWMDIPFLGLSVGWRNYKMISKAELAKVPILGRSIKVGGHVMVDRTNRKSQVRTLKSGMQCLKDGVHLVTFPEGTRSKTGRLLPFKNGAFMMAHKVGAPVIPVSIVHANKVNPPTWMFPGKPSRGLCKVVIHEPIESEGITEAELAQKVRDKIITGLPEDQRPLD